MNAESPNPQNGKPPASSIGAFFFVLVHLCLVAAVAALLVWRFWYQPSLSVRPPASQPPSLPASQPPSFPASQPPSLPASQPPSLPASQPPPPAPSLVCDGRFLNGFAHWGYWLPTNGDSNHIRLVDLQDLRGVGKAVRLENTDGDMIGVRQAVSVLSGVVYRLGAVARSSSGRTTNVLFGGRLAFFIPGQPEYDIVWMTEYESWWERSIVFTNLVSGSATIYVHLGYGGAATTGEFTDVRLDALDPHDPPQAP